MAEEPNNSAANPRLSRRLRLARGLTRFALLAERLVPRALPLVGVVALYAALSWFGFFRIVPDWLRIGVAASLGVAALASLWPLLAFRMAGGREIDRRLERANRLTHAPITAQDDRLAGQTDDPFAAVLWREHQRRLALGVPAVEAARARTGIPERDPFALRAVAALLVVFSFAWSFGVSGGSLGDAFRSHVRIETVPVRIDAWVTPPAYTGFAPVFLTSEQNAARTAFSVPAGSVAVVRIAGGKGSENVAWPSDETVLGTVTGEAPAARPGSRRFEVTLEATGELSINEGGEQLKAWGFEIMPDLPPSIAFKGDPVRAANGTMTVEYNATDDYRVAAARGIIELAEDGEGEARPLYDAPELPLALPRRSSKDGSAKTMKDLSEHPWAGARVTLRLEAEDDKGQKGFSETTTLVLPGRPFSNPVARAIIEQRRNLALDANSVPAIVDVIDVLTLYPEETIKDASVYLGLVTARTKLKSARGDDEALRGVVDYLWEFARAVEDGNLSEAERRLRAAQQALQEALENGASDEQIEQLMAELREAMQDYIRELARQMENNPELAEQTSPENMQQLEMQNLEEMLDRIEELAKSGSREQAQELLSQLQDMMNNLQMGRHNQQQGDGQNRAQQQMNELGEILRRQQELMNETYRQNRRGGEGEQSQQGQQGQQGEGQQGQGDQQQFGQNGQGGEGLQGLAPGQQGLQQRLDQFMEGLRGMGIDPGEAFDDAGRAMGDAGDQLMDGDGEGAFSSQGDAMQALREGADSMMQQMQQAMDGQTGASEPGGNRNGLNRDPLGRPQRSAGPDFGDSVEIPDEIDIRRAREILEAIRRRLGNALSPQLEKEYLERLLELN
ncbi:TIGR02302 family protein [Oricola sp.]|uniref:TIGR02302 family protein n=1 Tax=Oricola sp. TaxID=1979950 RepID=UPI003BAA3C41